MPPYIPTSIDYGGSQGCGNCVRPIECANACFGGRPCHGGSEPLSAESQRLGSIGRYTLSSDESRHGRASMPSPATQLGKLPLVTDAQPYERLVRCGPSFSLPTSNSCGRGCYDGMPSHDRDVFAYGTLHIKLCRAIHLKAMDRNGLSDPYSKLSLCDATRRSKTIKKTLNPIWDEIFTFKGQLSSLIHAPLRLDVWDYDTFARDDKLGYAVLDLREVEHSDVCDLRADLDTQGTVFLQAWWSPDMSAVGNSTGAFGTGCAARAVRNNEVPLVGASSAVPRMRTSHSLGPHESVPHTGGQVCSVQGEYGYGTPDML